MSEVDDWDGRNTLPMLYAKTATGAVQTWLCWVEANEVCVSYGQKNGALQHASFKCEPKNEGRSNETTGHEQAIKEAIAKWKKQKKKKYYESEEAALGTKRIKPLLATNFADHKSKIKYPVVVQPKFNGVRCLAYRKDGRVFLQSRGSDPYIVHHIMKELEPALESGIMLDGELYAHGMHLQDINSLVRRPREESQQLYYVVYDLVLLDEMRLEWARRRELLRNWFMRFGHSDRISQAWSDTVEREEDVAWYHDYMVKLGYEGAVVRTLTGEYRFGYRSPDLLKVKRFRDDEFEIVGFTAGRGKYENVPVFTCKTKEGQTFEVVPEGSMEHRAKLLAEAPSLTGRLLKVKFLEYSKEGVPVGNTVGLAIRDRDDM